MDTSFVTYDQEIKRIQLSIAIVTILVCSFAIFLTLIYFIFNVKYRNFRLIKMSSPTINNVINLNCLMLYLCPIFNSIKGLNIDNNERLSNAMCQINAWIIPICSTMLYGAMLAKAWRIFKIFDTTPKMKKIVIKDFRLLIYILILVSVDLSVCMIWQFYDSIKIRARYVYEILQPNIPLNTDTVSFTTNSKTLNSTNSNSSVFSNSLGSTASYNVNNTKFNTQIKILFECNATFNEVWITVLVIYKIILLMYGIYLSWLIKNVNVPSMNDGKYLLLSTYTIIVCGLGSMTLIQLLRDWPDVVQVFFTIGIVVATCTTQCLLFIPKIVLWYKRRNDDNFKISLSQIFLQSSSSCYYSDKQNKHSTNSSNGNMLNLEDELCELLHENSQLKNSLKEKEEIIKILQDKIRTAKLSLFQINEKFENKNDVCVTLLKNSENSLLNNQTASLSITASQKGTLTIDQNIIPAASTINRHTKMNNHSSGIENETINNNLIINNQAQSFENMLSKVPTNFESDSVWPKPMNSNVNLPTSTSLFKGNNIQTQQLKNDLDEVEELTSRVRDSISIDLSSTRRYSPLLYEYYRKQLELANSIQSTYNIQCNTLFDAMTLMRRCLKDYCQSVHNPEYFAIDSLQDTKNGPEIFQTKSNPMSNYNLNDDTTRSTIQLQNQFINMGLNINKSASFNNPSTIVNRQIKNILSSNTFSQRNKNDSANNTFFSSESTSASTSTTSSPSMASTPTKIFNSSTQLDPKLTTDNKQTYV